MSPEHNQSQELAVEAGKLMAGGRRNEARPLYIMAAELEKLALDKVPADKVRTRGILGVSWIAMLYKAGAFAAAEKGILELLPLQELPSESRWQLLELLEATWEERPVNGHIADSNGSDTKEGKSGDVTVEGVLRGVKLDCRWIEIAQADGANRRCYFDLTPLDDIIGPLFNRPVVARGNWDVVDGQRRFEIREISLKA